MSRTTSRRIPSLDGLRAVSILMVLCGHSIATLPAGWSIPSFLRPVLENAHLGVTVFFVISGYLITRLLQYELADTGRIDLPGFYLRRSLRILPVFYGYLVVMGLLAAWGAVQIAGSQFLAAGTFLWNYKQFLGVEGDQGDWYLGHFWSLAIEEQFYLVWPAVLLWLGPRRGMRWGALLLIAMPLIRIGSYLLWPGVRAQLSIMSHTSADPIIAGCLLALAPQVAVGAILRRWVRGSGIVIGVLFVLIVAPWLAHRFGGYYHSTVGPLIDTAVICGALSWLLENQGSRAARILNARPLAWIGRLSYSLYVWNQPFLTVLNTTWTGAFPINLLCNFAAAWISQQLLERPFLRWRERLRTHKSTSPVVEDQEQKS